VRGVDVLVQRLLVAAAIVVLSVGAIAMMLAGSLSGFARPRWLVLLAAGWGPAFLALLAAFVLLRRRSAASPTARESASFGQMPRTWLVIIGTLALIGGLVPLVMGLRVWIPAAALGPNPQHTAARQMAEGPDCYRCARPVWVAFETTDGRAVWERLAGADGLSDSDGPGTALVYDSANPSHVMRESDWRDGRGPQANGLMLGGIGALGGLIGVMALAMRHRRRMFGQMKPGQGIVKVRSRRARRGIAWQVAFADGSRTVYADTPRLRASLGSRTSPTVTEMSEADRALLARGTGPGGEGGSSS
jgi:hypothetical protein